MSRAVLEDADRDNGWLQGVRRVPSVNFNDRPENIPVDLLIIHNISLPPGEFSADDLSCSYIDDLFCNKLDVHAHPAFLSLQALRVSSHFLISRQGVVTQYVPLTKRAWHAGISQWQGRGNCNDYSVGIELEGTDHVPYTDHQYAVLTQLTQMLMQQYPAITAERIVGHRDVAPERKTDPGDAFDWLRYRSSLHS